MFKNIQPTVRAVLESIIAEKNLFDLATWREKELLFERPYYLEDFTTQEKTKQDVLLAVYLLEYTSLDNEVHQNPDDLVYEIHDRVITVERIASYFE